MTMTENGSFEIEGRPTFDEMIEWKNVLNSEWGELDDQLSRESDLYHQL